MQAIKSIFESLDPGTGPNAPYSQAQQNANTQSQMNGVSQGIGITGGNMITGGTGPLIRISGGVQPLPNVGVDTSNFIIKNQIEIKNGKAQRLRQHAGSSNQLLYYRYYGLQGICFFIIDTLGNWDNLILLIFIGIHFGADTEIELNSFTPVIILVLNLVFQALINILTDFKVRQACKSINQRNIQKFVNKHEGSGFETVSWESLRPGDIIIVKENDIFPADILILDSVNSTNDHKCYVRGGLHDNFNFPTPKKACQGTYNRPGMRMSSRKLVEQISGKVKYEYNYQGYFVGSFKLNNNPAAFQLSLENVVVKGSQLCHTKQVICLVLNVENESIGSPINQLSLRRQSNLSIFIPRRGSLLTILQPRRPSYDRNYYKPMRILQIILMILYFSMSFIVFFQIKLSPNTSQHKFFKMILGLYVDDEKLALELPIYIKQILAFTANLFLSLPLNYRIITDLVVIMHANFTEWDYNNVPSDLKIGSNKNVMKALGNITDLFMSKNAVMNLNAKKAKIVQVKDHWYFDQGKKSQAEQVDSELFEDQSSNQRFPRSNTGKFQVNLKPKQQISSSSVFGNYQYPFRTQEEPQNGRNSAQRRDRGIYLDDGLSSPGIGIQNTNIDEDEIDLLMDTAEDYQPNVFHYSRKFNNQRLAQEISQNSQIGKSIKNLMTAVIVCHEAKRVNEDGGKVRFSSINHEEESFLYLANSYGFQFLHKHDKQITLSIGNKALQQKLKQTIMVNHSFLYLGQQITVTVVKPYKAQSYQSGATFYARGPLSTIFNFLEESDSDRRENKHSLLEDMKKYAELGISPTAYVKRDLNGDEAIDLEGRINEALSLMKDQDDKIESSLLLYMHDMKTLGVIGTQDLFNHRDALVVQDLIKNGIRVWMLEDDDEIQATVAMNALNLLNAESNPFIINGETERDIEEQVTKCLNTLVEKSETLQDLHQSKLKHKSLSMNSHEETQTRSKSIEFSTSPLKKDQKQSKALMLTGHALLYILKEESLLKCLLTIASFCELVIGSGISPDQKCELMKALKQFNLDGVNQNIMALICQSKDQIVMSTADVSVALTSKNHQLSTTKILTDLSMNSLYPLTYVLFKHGTLCNRRIREVTRVQIYRTFFLSMILSTYMCIHGFSASLPFKRIMIIIFIVLVSPLQIILHGFSYRDVGYQYIYRVYGEYKRNFMVNLFNSYDLLEMIANSCIDAFIYFLFFIGIETPTIPQNGQQMTSDGYQLYNGIILYIMFTFHLLDRNETIHFFRLAFIFVNILGIIFILDDEYLLGVKQFSGCPLALMNLLLIFLLCLLRNTLNDLLRKVIYSPSRRRKEFYSEIEDRLFLEEYEDPNQEFYLDKFDQDHKIIEKKLNSRRLYVINQNLTKLPRSDDLDEIIEKLNEYQSGIQIKKYHDDAILNSFSLKFNDQNKEEEYNQSRRIDNIIAFRKFIIITLIFLALELVKDIVLSSLKIISFQSFWFYFGFSILALITQMFTYKFQKRVQLINLATLVFLSVFYSFCYYYIDNVEFSMFLSVLIYIFYLRGIYTRAVIIMASCLLVMNISLINSNFDSQISRHIMNISFERFPQLILPWIATIWTIYLISWAIFAFWKEKFIRLEFWQGQKKIKEFQKLKSILHILMPAFVRERIRQGQRFIADDQGEVSIIFCDIGDFDNIVQMFSGKELCEWLDNIYLSFDQLCEKHGLQKIETVGKTYMACGGLKQSEKKMDQSLLNRHHSVRVADFAINILNFIRRQTLKDGQRVKVKIGIHTGKVISGVVGENKPQFSLIGDAINKTSRVCSKCYDNHILISKETMQILQQHSSFYHYTQQIIDMKGIGRENAYYLRKGSSPQIASYNEAAQRTTNDIQRKQLKTFNEDIQLDTSRSQNYSDIMSIKVDPIEVGNKSLNESDAKLEDSFTQDQNFLNFGGFKDDRAIFKNAVENTAYNLIERPNYLLNFNQAQYHIEENFRYQKLQENQIQKLTFFIILFILNKLGFAFFYVETFGVQFYRESKTISIMLAFLCLVFVQELTIFIRIKTLTLQSTQLTMTLISFYYGVLLTGTVFQAWKMFHNTRLIQIIVNETMIIVSFVYFTSMIQMRQILVVHVLAAVCWIIVIATNSELSVKTYSFAMELGYFIAMFTFKSHMREMSLRKIHNRKIIMDFEIKRTNDLLSNLVPPPVLQGIKNDQKVVDELEDVTLLFTDMVGFTQFSNNVRDPREVVKLLSELFTRFDQLCVKNKVYKVHTIGDCYVIMGYTGHIPQNQRSQQIKADEAYRVTQTAFEMIDIIADVRNCSENPDLKDLNMRIGIHTGKIVAGIIGTKIVRYDIFGSDVLIANKMESNGLAGKVVVSEETKKLLISNKDFDTRLSFIHHKTVELQGIRRTVEAYIVNPSDDNSLVSEQSLVSQNQNDEDEYIEESLSHQSKQELSAIEGSQQQDLKEEIKIEDEF